MISAIEAKDIAGRYLQSLKFEGELVLLDEAIIEKPYGWIFFYTSAKYLETQALSDTLAGNAPFLVERETGHVTVFGTAYPTSHYIADYERKHMEKRV